MSTNTNEGRTQIEFDREERWVIHSVVLDYIELDHVTDGPVDIRGDPRYQVVEKIEDNHDSFSEYELNEIRIALQIYARQLNVPERDRNTVTDVLDRIQTAHPDLHT